jgi:hypothetical protein
MIMHDMSMSEMLKDPLIRQMLRADRISLGTFAELLETAAQKRARGFSAFNRNEIQADTRSNQHPVPFRRSGSDSGNVTGLNS